MRDIALSIVIFGLLPAIFWRPHIGALLWVWMSMMNPHKLSFGFAYNFPFAAIIAATTLIAMPLSKQKISFPRNPIVVLLFMFVAWMSVTSLFAMGSSEVIYNKWVFVLKIHLMLLVTLMLIRGREQIDQLVWVMVLSIGYFGVKGGVWTVLTGGGDRVFGPPTTMIEG